MMYEDITFNAVSLGQDGDCPLCCPLLVPDRMYLGSPGVRPDPIELPSNPLPHGGAKQLPDSWIYIEFIAE